MDSKLNDKLDEVIHKLDNINNQLKEGRKKGIQSNMMLAAAIVLYGVPLIVVTGLALHWIINESLYLSAYLYHIGVLSVIIVIVITIRFFDPIFKYMIARQAELGKTIRGKRE